MSISVEQSKAFKCFRPLMYCMQQLKKKRLLRSIRLQMNRHLLNLAKSKMEVTCRQVGERPISRQSLVHKSFKSYCNPSITYCYILSILLRHACDIIDQKQACLNAISLFTFEKPPTYT